MSNPAALPKPFPDVSVAGKWAKEPTMQGKLEAVARKPAFSTSVQAIALVDLSLRTRNPNLDSWNDYAGVNDDKEVFAGSMVKIAALFPAYRLRERVRKAAQALPALSGQDLFDAIEAAWKPVVTKAVPGKKEDFPKLNRIFDAPGGGQVNFTNTHTDPADYEKLHQRLEGIAAANDAAKKPATVGFAAAGAVLNPLGFRDRLGLMIRMSDNFASASIINDIGYQYINGALAAEGLFDPATDLGLWLGGDYAGTDWAYNPKGKTTKGATAAATAWYLTLLDTDRLAGGADSCNEMRTLMGRNGSWYTAGLQSRGRMPTAWYNKLGLLTLFSDASVIARVDGTKQVRYAAVVLNGNSSDVLEKLIVELDDIILARN